MDDGCHVLIVDDERDFRDTLGMLLQAHGYRVSAAPTGEDALELLTRQRLQPDIILLDHRMPGLSGAEAFARMREHGVKAPVLLVSAVDGVDALARAHGFTGAIRKPFSPDQLIECIRRTTPVGARDGDGPS